LLLPCWRLGLCWSLHLAVCWRLLLLLLAISRRVWIALGLSRCCLPLLWWIWVLLRLSLVWLGFSCAWILLCWRILLILSISLPLVELVLDRREDFRSQFLWKLIEHRWIYVVRSKQAVWVAESHFLLGWCLGWRLATSWLFVHFLFLLLGCLYWRLLLAFIKWETD